MTRVVVLIFVVLGCGSSKPKPTEGSGPITNNDRGFGGAEYGGYVRTPELHKLHDLVVAAADVKTACAKSGDVHSVAKAIVTATPPKGAEGQLWKGETQELASIAEDFAGNCKSKSADAKAIEYDWKSLQRSFQRLLKIIPRA